MAALRAALLAPLLALSRAGPGPAPSARIEVELAGPGAGNGAGNGAGEAAGPGGSYTLRGALLGGPREEAIGGRLLLVRGGWGSWGGWFWGAGRDVEAAGTGNTLPTPLLSLPGGVPVPPVPAPDAAMSPRWEMRSLSWVLRTAGSAWCRWARSRLTVPEVPRRSPSPPPWSAR